MQDGASAATAETIDELYAAEKSVAFYSGGPVAPYESFAKEFERRLLDFKPDGYEQIAPAFRDPDGAFTTVKVNQLVYAYKPSSSRRRTFRNSRPISSSRSSPAS